MNMAFQTPFSISTDRTLVSARREKHPQTTRDADLDRSALSLTDFPYYTYPNPGDCPLHAFRL